MKALVVLPFVPAANASQAGHRLAFDTIAKLAGTYDVSLFILLNREAAIPAELSALCKDGVTKIIVSRFATLYEWIFHATSVYPRFLTRFSRNALNHLLALHRLKKFDYIRFEFSQTFIFYYLLRQHFSDAQIVLSIHDLQFQVVLRKNNFEKYLCNWVRGSESFLLNCADQLVVLSEKDKVLVQAILDVGTDINVSPPTLSPFVNKLSVITHAPREKNTLLFWGAMNRIENESAVLEFIAKILTPLHKSGYNYKLYIVGSNPGSRILAHRSENIIITGFLDDPSDYFLKASIGVVPLKMGAGVKLKTLEMLESGIPCVIATPVGAEGVSGYNHQLIVRSFDNIFKELVNRYK